MSPLPLILTNSSDATSDYLCTRLQRADVPHLRLDTDLFLDTVELNMTSRERTLHWNGHTVRPSDVSALVLRRPKQFDPPVQGDEHQRDHAAGEWAEAVENFLAHIETARWINHPSRNARASHKADQLICARDVGLVAPPWLVTSTPASARKFYHAHGPEIVAKPLASGYIERPRPRDDTLIYTRAIDESHLALFERLPVCPVLLQKRVHKQIDVRLITIDGGIAAVGLQAKETDGSQRLDIRRNNMLDVSYSAVEVPECIAVAVRRMMKHYGLRFGAMDFAIDANDRWVFFELNPNGQWAWLDRDGRADVGQMFIDTLRDKPRRG